MSSSLVQASSTASFRAFAEEAVFDPPFALLPFFWSSARVMHYQKAFSRAHHLTSQVRSRRLRSIMSILIMAVDWDIDWDEVSFAR